MRGDKRTTSYNLSSFELTAVLSVPGKHLETAITVVGTNLHPITNSTIWSSNVPYYRILPLHEIKVFEINATQINANFIENDYRITEISTKKRVTFLNERNERQGNMRKQKQR